MKALYLGILMTGLFSMNLVGQHTGTSSRTNSGYTISIPSVFLEDSVELYIHQPDHFVAQDKYPLVLLFDAYSSFKVFSSCTELMAEERIIPSCIVVGFPQRKYAGFDSTNLEFKIDLIAKFISEELFPYLGSKYKTSKTIVWGQGDQSGLLVTSLFLKHPDTFNAYIADIPNLSLLGNGALTKKAFEQLSNKVLSFYLFGNSSEGIFNEAFLFNLKTNTPNGIEWNYSVSDETNMISHFSKNYMYAIESYFSSE